MWITFTRANHVWRCEHVEQNTLYADRFSLATVQFADLHLSSIDRKSRPASRFPQVCDCDDNQATSRPNASTLKSARPPSFAYFAVRSPAPVNTCAVRSTVAKKPFLGENRLRALFE